MRALAGKIRLSLSDNVWTILEYLAESFSAARIVDPANTNNVISDDLTATEKQSIAAAARTARNAPTWEEIVR
ncbi:hypothetical protein [Terriglobus saanensis]|uniref:hypothetical protein n=1 Tax=Terriglobus saanensis TaxID=870903 RepID=UPI000325F1F5|nr:hypothetical protein [Terriglobus saanensis]